MRIHDKLDEILKQGSKIKILRFLFAENDEHTGRSIAKGIGMSPSCTYTTLQVMGREGLVSARKKGSAILYKLQEGNYVVKKLVAPMFQKEKSLYNDIVLFIKKSLLQHKKAIISLAIFGSIAQEKETARSDIDVLIIVQNKHAKTTIDKAMDELSAAVAKKFSAAISAYILTKPEMRQRYHKKQPLIISIVENNRLIYGEPLERILA